MTPKPNKLLKLNTNMNLIIQKIQIQGRIEYFDNTFKT